MYDFSRVANRPTQTMRSTITSAKKAMQCSVLHHHKCTGEEVLGSSARLTPGDVGCDQVTKTPEEIGPC